MFNVIAPLVISVGAALGALYGASEFISPMHGAHTHPLTTAQNLINGSSIMSREDLQTLHSA